MNLDMSEFKKMTMELHKIGVNINQISKVVNETKSVYQSDMNGLTEKVEEIWRLLRLKMSKLT